MSLISEIKGLAKKEPHSPIGIAFSQINDEVNAILEADDPEVHSTICTSCTNLLDIANVLYAGVTYDQLLILTESLIGNTIKIAIANDLLLVRGNSKVEVSRMNESLEKQLELFDEEEDA